MKKRHFGARPARRRSAIMLRGTLLKRTIDSCIRLTTDWLYRAKNAQDVLFARLQYLEAAKKSARRKQVKNANLFLHMALGEVPR